ncbi:MAG: redoxin domain-containing protein [Planctomycetes bacterium]|nr:redoxin domain-containing protein [Planctomycetota bacterium]
MTPRVEAPELHGEVGWLNTDSPLRLRDLRGKIVLLDFWTYCCINCLHVFADLKRLEKKYRDVLVVIGIHSAKFNAEKDPEGLRAAVLRHEIEHPVANDAEMAIWSTYGVRGWPTLALIDPEGNLIGGVSGEGHFDLLDHLIAHEVEQATARESLDRRPRSFRRERALPAILAFPGKLCAGTEPARLFVADTNHHRVLEVEPAGRVVAAYGCGVAGFVDGPSVDACFRQPQGLALRDGTLFVADAGNHALRAVDLGGATVRTVAGTGKQGRGPLSRGKATKVALNSPWDLAVVGGRLFVAMAGAHQICVLHLREKTIEAHAGDGREEIVDGPLAEASFAQPSGLALGDGCLFVADAEVSGIRAVDLDPQGFVSTVVGEGLFEFGDRDGRGAMVRLQHPLGCVWHDGRLWVADTYNHKLKVVDPAERTVTTVAGDGRPGSEDGRRARFHEPAGVAVLGNILYIADTNNHAIRTYDPATGEVATLRLTGLPA